MSKFLDADKMKIGYVVLVATRKFAIERLQRKAGFNESSNWWATMNNLPYNVNEHITYGAVY